MKSINIGERLSFFQLIDGKQFKIEVPIIQRDYAQGRVEEIEVRDGFIDALKDYLDENIPNRDLDFVYGSLSGNKFIPLDGQQRLTTLFLLHWYTATKEDEFEKLQQWLLDKLNEKSSVSKFSYKTRTTSELFCNLLLNTVIDLKNLLPSDVDEAGVDLKNALSKTIRDRGGFFSTWQNDPTIKSMLNMLDTIHNKFRDSMVDNYYNRLVNNESPIITFLLLNLDEFNLTDDLYIKMNSRGIPLTTFENFKAKLLQFIKLKMQFQESKLLKDSKVSVLEYFSCKIDTNWTNLFWAYSKDEQNKSIDKKMMNFIRFCFAASYALSDYKSENMEYLLGTSLAKNREGYSDDISFNKYLSLNSISESSIQLLMNSLDCLENGDQKIKKLISSDFLFYFNDAIIFEKILADELTFISRIQFYAYLRFLIQNKGDLKGIDDWVRVVYNLSENRALDNADDFVNASIEIEKLVPESNNILRYLRGNPDIDFFYSRQIQEEKLKAYLLEKEDWIDIILEMEKHSYFKGQILFIFEFSGVLKYFEENDDCNWSTLENQEFLNSFNQYCEKIKSVFRDDPNQLPDFIWARAVLSKGNYLISASANRFNFLTTSKNLRDYSWKRLLRLPPSNDGNVDWRKKRTYVKEVFDDADFDKDNIILSLTKIYEKFQKEGWRKYFIANPEFLKYCEQGFIRKDNNDILLYKESQSNHTHLELYTYNLYLNKFKMQALPPFNQAGMFPTKSIDEIPCTYMGNWKYKETNSNYAIDIRNTSFDNFEIRFFDRNLPQSYSQDILDLLFKFGFIKNDKYRDDSYTLTSTTENLLSLIKNVCDAFNSKDVIEI
jgi:hypothetical protein